jgi:hypothetical protein
VAKIDKEAYQQRLDRITELFAAMVEKADAQSQLRCPYRDRHDRCTAMFSCRNRRPEAGGEGRDRCGHDGHFDYRDAWESKPETKVRAKRKIERIRTEARRRRAEKAGGKAPE